MGSYFYDGGELNEEVACRIRLGTLWVFEERPLSVLS